MIVAVEIIVGPNPEPEVEAAADVLAEACRVREFPAHRLSGPTTVDNRLCVYLSTLTSGYAVEDLLDLGVRRDAFARLDHTQYLVRSWRGQARLHVALAARAGPALVAAAEFLAARIVGKDDFSHLDTQGPAYAEGD